jgi:hypothetical protein
MFSPVRSLDAEIRGSSFAMGLAKSHRAKRASYRLRVMVLLCVLEMPIAFAQQNPPVSQDTVLTFAHDFLRVFYPELISRGHRLRLSITHPADDSWRGISGVYFTILPERPSDYGVPRYQNGRLAPENKPDPETILLDGSIWLPPHERGSRIREVNLSSGSGGERKLKILRKLIESHPEWSDEQAVKALKQDGASFGPDEKLSFINTLPFDKAEPFLGRLRVTSVEFNHLQRERVENFAGATMDWTVSADAFFSDGTSGKYVFNFEPYQGKLTLLTRLD